MNSQVVLKGIESEGCVLVAAGNARILNRLHIPVWSKGEIFNKNTWFGNVENLQVILLTCRQLRLPRAQLVVSRKCEIHILSKS